MYDGACKGSHCTAIAGCSHDAFLHAQIPGSRASSLAYEDAVSQGFTPDTTASLLDFDTPFASPTSPIATQVHISFLCTLPLFLCDVERKNGRVLTGTKTACLRLQHA